jgi:peptide/nickel transport system permease protein
VARYVAQRLLGAIPLLVIVSIITFALVLLLPGDPAITIAGDAASESTIAAIRERLGENDPLVERYLSWVGGALHGDFGTTVVSLGIALLISLPTGLLAGLRPNTVLDRALTVGTSMGVAIPSFWMGLLLSVIFAVKTDLLPAIGYVGLTEDPVEWLRHLLLPAFSLGLASSATLTRQLRGSVITAMQQDYIRTARAKGLRHRSVVFKHLLKNASMPAVTALGLQIPVLLSGTVIIEGLFGLNGIGQFAVSAVMRRDLHVVQAVVLLSAVVVVFVNIAVDVSYAFLNPKTRLR